MLPHGFSINNWLILNGFNFEDVDETFYTSTLPAIAFTTHALHQIMFAQ